MPEIICADCGKEIFHENESTLKAQEVIHKKFCRKEDGKIKSYMHREEFGDKPMDPERERDEKGQPILKK